MRYLSYLLLGGIVLGTMACDRPQNTEDRQARQEKVDRAAHQAGEDLYKAAQKTKEVTKEAVEGVKKAGREAKDGWEDAKHKDPARDSTHPDQ
jgi:hypothetical protein